MTTTTPADSLGPWVREMDLADQVFLTGATLVLADIRRRYDDLPTPYDEAELREGTPQSAYRAAAALARSYATPPRQRSAQPDDLWRIANLAAGVAARIQRYHPDVR